MLQFGLARGTHIVSRYAIHALCIPSHPMWRSHPSLLVFMLVRSKCSKRKTASPHRDRVNCINASCLLYIMITTSSPHRLQEVAAKSPSKLREIKSSGTGPGINLDRNRRRRQCCTSSSPSPSYPATRGSIHRRCLNWHYLQDWEWIPAHSEIIFF